MRPRSRRLTRIVWLFAVGLFAVSGCTRRSTAVQTATREGILLTSAAGEPSELDPHIINAPPDYIIVPSLFEGLLSADPQTLQPRPGVAETCEISPDGLVYTFHLRANAKWSNGDAITAADFTYSIQRALSPALGSQYTFLFDAVVGATAFASGQSHDFSTVGVSAPDSNTVRLQLTRPVPYLLSVIANNPIWYPVPRKAIEQHGRIDQRGTGWTKPGHFVGNGPFTLKTWQPGQRIILERSSTYWNAANIRLNGITFFAFTSVEAEERAFRAGQLHSTALLPLTRLAYYREKEPRLLHQRPLLTTTFVNVNTTRPPLNDVRVRRALSISLPRAAIIKTATFGAGTPARRLVPPGLAGYVSPPEPSEDVAAARAALSAAGFPEGRGFPRLEFMVDAGSQSTVAQALQESWRRNLGIGVALVGVESRVLWTNQQTKNFTLAIGGWAGDYDDPSTFLDLFRTGQGWNFTGWSDPEYDTLVTRSSLELNAEKRMKLLAEAEARLLAAHPIIPLNFRDETCLVDLSVRGYPDNIEERRYLWDVRLEPR